MSEVYPRYDIGRVSVIPDLSVSCPCGAAVTRSDTGMCERCTAKLPAQQLAAAQWRQKCLSAPPRTFSQPLAGDTCSVCGKEYQGVQRTHRIFDCEKRPHVCGECDHRFDTPWELTRHQKEAHGRTDV